MILIMTLDELFRNFTDEEFQYNRFLKTKTFTFEMLEKYSKLFESIKNFTIRMSLNDEISSALNSTKRLELNYHPNISIFRKILGFFTFGLSTKRYVNRMKVNFYTREIYQRHMLIKSVRLTLENE